MSNCQTMPYHSPFPPAEQERSSLSTSNFFVTITKILERNNLEEVKFILAHGFGGSAHG